MRLFGGGECRSTAQSSTEFSRTWFSVTRSAAPRMPGTRWKFPEWRPSREVINGPHCEAAEGVTFNFKWADNNSENYRQRAPVSTGAVGLSHPLQFTGLAWRSLSPVAV